MKRPIFMPDISMTSALDLWSQLERAYHGTNSYGGDEAEIYAYQLLPRDPLAQQGLGQIGSTGAGGAAGFSVPLRLAFVLRGDARDEHLHRRATIG